MTEMTNGKAFHSGYPRPGCVGGRTPATDDRHELIQLEIPSDYFRKINVLDAAFGLQLHDRVRLIAIPFFGIQYSAANDRSVLFVVEDAFVENGISPFLPALTFWKICENRNMRTSRYLFAKHPS